MQLRLNAIIRNFLIPINMNYVTVKRTRGELGDEGRLKNFSEISSIQVVLFHFITQVLP